MLRSLAVLMASGLILAASCFGAASQTAFYTADPAAIANGKPGSLIRNEKIDVSPYGGSKYRVLYRSVGVKGEPIAVSGMIFVPGGDEPAGGWPIVAWAHPTSGLVPKCAPSVAGFGTDQVQGLEALMQEGYVVTATDYPGLGTPGPQPFLVGESEGRAVLDSIRAARELMGGTSAYAAVWGHSQGGQAVLFAGKLAPDYAPDVKLLGVGAAAPATILAQLLRDDLNTGGGKNLLAMTLYSWNEVFDAPITQVVEPKAMPVVDALAQVCLETIEDLPARYIDGEELMQGFLSVDDITALEPWKGLMDTNTIGPLHKGMPVLLLQGDKDQTVPESVTASYFAESCKAGSNVSMQVMPGVDHMTAAKEGAPHFIQWLGDLVAGTPAASNCR
ncbi:alpha/beta fold hydrolase [Devosia sp. CN2-171]|uniref:alpha/beta fold hydrolase n=1 Tax=Devosia sp. CN2-171 TaxID=3400909 RepID=UPI003BF84774